MSYVSGSMLQQGFPCHQQIREGWDFVGFDGVEPMDEKPDNANASSHDLMRCSERAGGLRWWRAGVVVYVCVTKNRKKS